MTASRLSGGKIDEHYSLARSNSFPIFRGGMGKRRDRTREATGFESAGVRRFGIICWLTVDRPIFLPLPPRSLSLSLPPSRPNSFAPPALQRVFNE